MKRILIILLSLCFVFGFAACKGETKEAEEYYEVCGGNAVTGVWLTVYELAPDENSNKSEYREKINETAKNCKELGITDAFVQVRANCDSIYPSEYFKPNKLFCRDGKLICDCLEVITEAFHEKGIRVHAWINPYRISAVSVPEESDPIFSFVENDDVFITENGGAYLKPSSEKASLLILSGVREILESYDVDGLHIDDYFYPETNEEFDLPEYERYSRDGGALSFSDWRRNCVSALVSSMYSAVKSEDESLVFSISPCGDIEKNMNTLYADVKLWCSSEGYADMIIPQIYYGFENSAMPFEKCLSDWRKAAKSGKVRLLTGLAAYKAGKEDAYAGKGKNEWLENDDILKRQANIAYEKTDGIVLFSYSYMFVDNKLTKTELKNLSCVIKSNQQ